MAIAEFTRFIWVSMTLTLTALLVSGCATVTPGHQGLWRYQQNAVVIELDLMADSRCRLSLQNFVAKPVAKNCKFERNNNPEKSDNDFLLFLEDANGHCDIFADYEFAYEPEAGIVTLTVGGADFIMQGQ